MLMEEHGASKVSGWPLAASSMVEFSGTIGKTTERMPPVHSLRLIRNILFVSSPLARSCSRSGVAEGEAPYSHCLFRQSAGESDPCGCRVNRTGGLNRVQTLLDQEKKNHPDGPVNYVNSGDTFFGAGAQSGQNTTGGITREDYRGSLPKVRGRCVDAGREEFRRAGNC